MENMVDAATARYRKEAAKLTRCKEIVRKMNESGDKSSNERSRVKRRLWRTEMRLSGMRSMAKAVGIDLSALDAPG